ncbi:MAG: zinc-ribbon domain-containing protein [Acidobacteria bacterium]|nr:zinc-ribbon domain-containing protein [Acidobacteriota bacterium]MCB9398861.1 zinc-ribbon domain-containing protein [Acidobacteriota bacterium]
MILECPSCSARYKVDASLIPVQGKKVRCKKCNSIFKADSEGNCELLEAGEAAPTKPEPEKPKTQPAAAATVMIDSAQIQAMVAKGSKPPAPPVPQNVVVEQKPPQKAPVRDPLAQLGDFEAPRKPATDFPEMGESSEEFTKPDWDAPVGFGTVRMKTVEQPNNFSTQSMPVAKFEPPKPPAEAKNSEESPLFSELDQFDFGVSKKAEPPAPPQNELGDLSFGLDQEPEPEFESNTIMANTSFDEIKHDVPDPVGFADIETNFGPPAPKPAASPAADPQPSAGPVFQARIEKQIYPRLSLDVVERWVREGRLLESDELAHQGSNDFQRADAYPEIKALFQQYYGKPKSSDKPAEKKGFFARLFGR